MTTDHLLNRLADRLGLSHRQRHRLLPELAEALAHGLQTDGKVGLGELGHARLAVQPALRGPGGCVLPERTVLRLRPSNFLGAAVEVLPLTFARQIEADTIPRKEWDPAPGSAARRREEGAHA